MRSIELWENYYSRFDGIFQKGSVTVKPGVTVLVGCNGSGKTTFLQMAKEQLEEKGIPCLYYDNLSDGGDTARESAGFYGDIGFLASALCASEGENIAMNIGRFAHRIGKEVHGLIGAGNKPKEIWILVDAADSGLSIDNVREMKQYLLKFVMDDFQKHGIEPYFIVSANSYELACGEQCLDVAQCRYMRFSSYEEYADFIMASREQKEKWNVK